MITPINFLDVVYAILKEHGMIDEDFSLLLYFVGDCATWLRSPKDKIVTQEAEKLMNKLNCEAKTKTLQTQINDVYIVANRWRGGILVLASTSKETKQIIQSSLKKLGVSLGFYLIKNPRIVDSGIFFTM